jgi:hypothetical protein
MQSITFALKLMRQHGMSQICLQNVFKATSISKLLYASPSWWGFISKALLDRIEAFLRRAKKFGYYSASESDAKTLCENADSNLFKRVKSNPDHVLRPFLPPQRISKHALRKRPHNFELPRKDNRIFLNRMLFSNIY